MRHPDRCDAPLYEQRCVPREGEAPLLMSDELDELLVELGGGWHLKFGHHLSRTYTFHDFDEALEFTHQVGKMAVAEGHHPDITVSFGKAEVVLFTHAIDGLTRNDFILASKISRLEEKRIAV